MTDDRSRGRCAATRMLRAWLLAIVVGLSVGGVAHADPPGPTDFLSEVVSITPDVPGLSARIIGGDSFFELRVGPDVQVDVVVVGYRGEPFVRYLPGGEVQENELSPTRYLSTSRDDSGQVPPQADADADPRWRTVATDGVWAWHDHRTHWMSAQDPPGARPGEQILEAVVPLLVGGDDVAITVISTWASPASDVPAAIGIALGLIAAAGVWRLRRTQAPLPFALVGFAALAALAIGLVQTWSVPAQTGPPLTAWALPLSADLVCTAGMVLSVVRRRSWTAFSTASVVLVACAQLVVWAWLRRDVLDKAILPTSAPGWLDRSVTAGVGVAAALAFVGALASIIGQVVSGGSVEPDRVTAQSASDSM